MECYLRSYICFYKCIFLYIILIRECYVFKYIHSIFLKTLICDIISIKRNKLILSFYAFYKKKKHIKMMNVFDNFFVYEFLVWTL